MATPDELLTPFARSILAKAAALRSINLLPNQRARILESISDDIKKCTNFIPPEVSKAAREEAERLGIDLYSKNWHDQPAFDAGRETFHFEHVLPVSAIRDACLTLNSEESIFNVLKGRLRVAWILKTEDAELTRLGYRSKRPDPDAAYDEAHIQLLRRESYSES